MQVLSDLALVAGLALERLVRAGLQLVHVIRVARAAELGRFDVLLRTVETGQRHPDEHENAELPP